MDGVMCDAVEGALKLVRPRGSGGYQIIGSDFVDALQCFAEDEETDSLRDDHLYMDHRSIRGPLQNPSTAPNRPNPPHDPSRFFTDISNIAIKIIQGPETNLEQFGLAP